jgi:hypothetical protein
MDALLISRMKALDEEKRLKKIYAKKSMQNDLLKEPLEKSGKAVSAQRDRPMGRAIQIRQYPVCMLDVQHQRDLLSVSAEVLLVRTPQSRRKVVGPPLRAWRRRFQ